ncbi:MAG: RidA family protein [Proteobacteria bacterium]|nr:RidA family protein [Pseudomonadota bacterium]
MAGQIDARLKELGIALPDAPAPRANYVGYVITGNLIFTAGQVPLRDGKLEFIGKLGRDMEVEQGYEAAKLCAVNVLAQVKAALGGDLERIVRCVKLTGFVNSAPDFGDQPKVINGASDLIVAVLGDKGKHARSAVGMGGLPFGVAAEVEGVFEFR